MTIRRPIFVVPLDLGTITGSSTAGYPASNLNRHKALGLTWRNAGGGTISGNFAGGAKQVDFCAMLSANAVAGTTIAVTAGGYSSGAQPFINPSITREDGLYHSFTEFTSVQTTASWSVTVSHSGAFEGAFLVFGKKVEPAKFYDRDFQFGIEDTGSAELARSGVWDAQDGMILRTVGMAFNWQSEAEWEEQFRPMIEKVGMTKPLYCCFAPEANAYRQNRTYFGRFQKSPVATGRRMPKTFGAEYTMLSLV